MASKGSAARRVPEIPSSAGDGIGSRVGLKRRHVAVTRTFSIQNGVTIMSNNTTNNSSLRNLGRIGARGMVVHSGRAAEGRYGYYPDNEEETWHSKAVDFETYAEKHKVDPTVVKTLVSYGVPVTVVPGKSRRAEKHTILVNLDAFRGLKADRKGARRADESPMGEMPEQFDGLLIQEDEKYYALAPTDVRPLEP